MFEAVLKGITLGLLLTISVGPVVFSIIKQSLNNGHRGGIAFILGVSASDIALVLVSNVFTQLFGYMVEHKNLIGIVGSVFLISMGIFFIFFKKVKVDDSGVQVLNLTKKDYVKTFLSGFFMNTLNPAVFIFWLTTSTTLITLTVENRVIAFVTCRLCLIILINGHRCFGFIVANPRIPKTLIGTVETIIISGQQKAICLGKKFL